MAFYTSIAPGKPAIDHAEQWAATSDDDLISWEKLPVNPVLSEAVHAGTKIYDWRDPFIFCDKKRTFMVLGGSLNESKGGKAVATLPLYACATCTNVFLDPLALTRGYEDRPRTNSPSPSGRSYSDWSLINSARKDRKA